MNNKFLLPGVLLLTVVNLASLGTLAYNKWTKPKKPCCEASCLLEEKACAQLSLTKKQKKDMLQVRSTFESNLIQSNEKIQKAQRELLTLLRDPAPDTLKVFSTLSKIQSMQGCLQKQIVGNILSEKEILDTKQCSLYCNMIQDRLVSTDTSNTTIN